MPVPSKLKLDLPVFLRLIDCVALAVFTTVDEKVRLVGERLTSGPVVEVGQLLTRFATFNEPSPVAWSYPAVALKAGLPFERDRTPAGSPA